MGQRRPVGSGPPRSLIPSAGRPGDAENAKPSGFARMRIAMSAIPEKHHIDKRTDLVRRPDQRLQSERAAIHV